MTEKGTNNSLVTVFGASGFIGQYLVDGLMEKGCRVRLVSRSSSKLELMKKKYGAQNCEHVVCDSTQINDVQKAVEGSDLVVNLIGVLYQKGTSNFQNAHVDSPMKIAQSCKKYGVKGFVHLSAMGADIQSPSIYARSKAEGERQTRQQFDKTAIIRPSVVFGSGDGFMTLFNKLSRFMPYLPLIGGGQTRFQPVFVGDVVEGVLAVIKKINDGDMSVFQKIYELGGPDVYSFKELMQMLLRVTGRNRFLIPVPWLLADVMGRGMSLLPRPLLTRDQVILLQSDNVKGDEHPGLKELGIQPQKMEPIVREYID